MNGQTSLFFNHIGRHIMEAKSITFFLGAGASIPFIKNENTALSTQSLYYSLFDDTIWDVVLKEYHKAKPPSVVANICYDDVKKLLGRLNELTSVHAQWKNNFEPLIHLLDKVCDYLSARSSREFGNIDSMLFEIWQKPERQFLSCCTDHDGWRYVPLLAREVIVSKIIELWASLSISDLKRIKDLHWKFYGDRVLEYNSVNIYSLNYDPLIYESLQGSSSPFSFGFEVAAPKQFSVHETLASKHTALFVHGHVGFIPQDDRPCFEDDYSKAQDSRIKGIFTGSASTATTGMKGISRNTFMITGYDKMESFSSNPYAAFMLRFSKSILENECLVIIGSSLSDVHWNSIMKNMLEVGNKKLIVVVWYDRKAKAFDLGVEISQLTEIGHLLTNFQAPISTFSLPSHVLTVNTDINSQGYAKLADNVALYVDGAEAFYTMNNINSILAIL